MWFCLWAWEDRTEIRLEPISWRAIPDFADDADGNLHFVYIGGRALNVVWVIYQTGGRNRRAGAASDMLMKLCYIPYYLLAAFMVLAGFATFYVWRSRDYRRDVDCGCPVFDTAVHLRTVRLHPRAVKKLPVGQQLPCRYCTLSLCAGRCGGGRRILYRTRQTQTSETDGGCQTAADDVSELNK